MYHDGESVRRHKLWKLLAVCAVAVLAGVTLWGLQRRIGRDMAEQSAAALKSAVVQAAVQCYAVEGAYPQDFDYLEQNYGLQVNHKAFIVSYEAFASNRLPDIQVLAKQ